MSGKQRIAKPSLLDRMLARIAPVFGARRRVASLQMRAVRDIRNDYDAARKTARTQFWRRHIRDANGETLGQAATLRNVSRDSVRNNPYASRIAGAIPANVVGSGIKPVIAARTKRAEKRLKQRVADHLETTDIDADGRHDIYGLQLLAMRAIVESGEVLIRRRRRRASDGYALPFQVQILEADHLDTSKNGTLPSGNIAVQGVEFDLRGRRVAYWLFPVHPGAVERSVMLQSIRVSADQIAHVYRVDRPGQVRGVTWLAPVLVRLNDLADYIDAQLVRQKIAACFTAFIRGTAADADVPAGGIETSEQGYRVEGLEPGMVEYLGEGEEVSFATPPKVDGFSDYMKGTLREIATGLGMPYTVLTGDLTGVNFSSGRMGWLEFQRLISSWTSHMLVPAMLAPIGKWTLEAAALAEGVDAAGAKITWRAPRREMVDPKAELDAASRMIRNGFSSRTRETQRFGYDADEVEAEIAIENERADAAGLKFDSDPRQMSAQGQEQPSANEDDAGETPADDDSETTEADDAE